MQLEGILFQFSQDLKNDFGHYRSTVMMWLSVRPVQIDQEVCDSNLKLHRKLPERSAVDAGLRVGNDEADRQRSEEKEEEEHSEVEIVGAGSPKHLLTGNIAGHARPCPDVKHDDEL